jgi:hypothetical protein
MNEAIRSHTVRSNDASLFILLCEGQHIPSTTVHWFHNLNTSVPCPGHETCIHHDKPAIWKGYAPVLMFRSKWKWRDFSASGLLNYVRRFDHSQWWRRALELTQNVNELCDTGKRGMAFVLKRPDYRRNAPLELEYLDVPPLKLPDVLNFDPRAVMERAFNKIGDKQGEIAGGENNVA